MRAAALGAAAVLVAACAGSASARTTAAGFAPIASGFSSPVYVTAPASEPKNLYVVEQTGAVRVLVDGQLRDEPFLDLGDDISCCGERGLLSLAFDPSYSTNHRVYTYSTDPAGNIRVDRFTTDGTRVLPATRTQLLSIVHQPYDNHNGGLLQVAGRRLYAATGDGGSGGDPQDNSQNLNVRLGKLLSLDLTRPSEGWRMVAFGLRNPWRWSFDSDTGNLWIGDVGQGAWEEIDVLPPGSALTNFEWPAFEGREPYRDAELARQGRRREPAFVYSHVGGNCAVIGGYVYRGAVASARGRYVFGDLCTGTVWSLKVSGTSLSALSTLGPRLPGLTSFGRDAAGELYATTQSGSVYRLHA